MLETRDVARFFDVSRPLLQRLIAREGKRMLRAVDGVSFAIPKGTTLSLVGESGCGKSTVARLVVGLYPPTRGAVRFDGQDLAAARADASQRQRIQMIFQDPYASLNPRWRVRDIIAEPIRAFGLAQSNAEVEARVGQLLTQVGLSPLDGQKFPHEFSGGQRQRISIARALSSNPEFLVCDEPTSALDVSVQAQILDFLQDLRSRFGLTYLFISHNLAVVRQVCDRVAVMYLGRIVEEAPVDAIFTAPRHPYTRALIASVLPPRPSGIPAAPLGGDVPNAADIPPGCRFAPRCPVRMERCTREDPMLAGAAHRVACWAATPEGPDHARN
jgi:peptide/nickel transport system ATP-binding protein